jgi:glucose-1-phosphate thymidylyltransferase
VFIDPKADVRHSVVGPYVSIAAGCRIEDSILCDSVVDAEAEISHLVIRESLVGRQAQLSGKPSSLLVGDSSEMRLT